MFFTEAENTKLFLLRKKGRDEFHPEFVILEFIRKRKLLELISFYLLFFGNLFEEIN